MCTSVVPVAVSKHILALLSYKHQTADREVGVLGYVLVSKINMWLRRSSATKALSR